MHTIRWTLSAAGLPGALRRCACCSEMRAFFPTDMFRVNANGRRLDVFLIYKCEACQKTWNMEVVSRVRPEEIAPDTYRRYLQNDPEEAACCASDPLLWKKNRMRLCEARPTGAWRARARSLSSGTHSGPAAARCLSSGPKSGMMNQNREERNIENMLKKIQHA